MASSIYDDIRATLETHLSTMTGVPSISYENVSYEPPEGADWCKTQLLPTRRRPACRGTSPKQLYEGVFTVFCYSPEGIGPSRSDDLSDKVITRFDATTDIFFNPVTNSLLTEEGAYLVLQDGSRTLLNDVVVVSINYAERSQGINAQPYYYVPVDISWYYYS